MSDDKRPREHPAPDEYWYPNSVVNKLSEDCIALRAQLDELTQHIPKVPTAPYEQELARQLSAESAMRTQDIKLLNQAHERIDRLKELLHDIGKEQGINLDDIDERIAGIEREHGNETT